MAAVGDGMGHGRQTVGSAGCRQARRGLRGVKRQAPVRKQPPPWVQGGDVARREQRRGHGGEKGVQRGQAAGAVCETDEPWVHQGAETRNGGGGASNGRPWGRNGGRLGSYTTYAGDAAPTRAGTAARGRTGGGRWWLMGEKGRMGPWGL
jgi:hypothetical protein